MFIYVAFPPANFFDIRCDILELKGDNYKVWKKRILLHLGCMDIDYVIRKNELQITETNTPAKLALHELWKQSNYLSVMFIETKISASICGSIDQHNNFKALLISNLRLQLRY